MNKTRVKFLGFIINILNLVKWSMTLSLEATCEHSGDEPEVELGRLARRWLNIAAP